jgi:hypoxanthine-DNA glycosylase
MTLIVHPWEPVFDSNSRVLILGTIPSPKSRENGFYYGHPQNSFWQTLGAVTGEGAPPPDVRSKRDFLARNHIALWDVLHSCVIDGAADASIRGAVPNRFRWLLDQTRIQAIFTTGRKATELFRRRCAGEAGMEARYLPSTSPANRAMQARAEFMEEWMAVRAFLDGAATAGQAP